jgi:hypothetical protein
MPTKTSSERQSSSMRYRLMCAVCGRDLPIINSCIDKELWDFTDEIVCKIFPCRCQTKILDDLRDAFGTLIGMNDENEKRIIAEMRGDEGRPQTREEMLAEVSKNTGLPLDTEPEQAAEAQE